MTATTVIFATFGVYMVLLLGVGYWGERRFGKGYAGFVAAERSIGGLVSGISAAASAESAWVMLALSGLGWKHGLASYWAAGGCSVGFIATSLFVVRQLRRSAARSGEVLTLGDYLAEHLGGSRPGARKALRTVSSLLITFFLTVYVVAQFTGAGKQMVKMQLLSYRGGVLVGAIIVGLYVLVGGYAAVCWTDTIQGLLMIAVMIALPAYALLRAGGVRGVGAALRAHGIASLWVGGAGPTRKAVGFAVTYFGFALGYPGMPHAIIRYITVKDDAAARRAAWIGASYATLILFGAATFGICGRALIPSLADHEQILPAFTAAFFHPLFGGVVLAAVSAAMMSTADSQLMMSATAIVHDSWNMVVRGQPATGRRMMLQTRAVIAALALAALALALAQPRVIDTLVLFAWGCLGAAFSPVILLCLYWPRFSWQGALASFVVGPATIVIWQLAGLDSTVHGLIPGTALSVVAAVVVSLIAGSGGARR